jgi:hypothetical protein
LTAGLSGFPLGDLNWFPAAKTTWNAQKDVEHARIEMAVQGGHLVGVDRTENIPQVFSLKQNYPNPFNPATSIEFTLQRAGNVSLKVFDILGNEITTLVNGYTEAGPHTVKFNASDLASGVYFYKLMSGSSSEVKKMVLMK